MILILLGSLCLLDSTLAMSFLHPSLTGFDCTENPSSVVEISLNEVKECKKSYGGPINKTVEIQIVQQNEDIELNTISCKILVERFVSKCSTFNDMQAVPNSFASFYADMTLEKCKYIIETQTYSDYGTMNSLIVNGVTSRPVLLAGSIEGTSDCTGGYYSDQFGTYSNVVVNANIEITLYKSLAKFNSKTDEIYLPTGTKCVFSKGTCFDTIRGPTFWDISLQQDHCSSSFYTVLYEGKAVTLTTQNHDSPTIYLVNSDKHAFSLKALKKTRVCLYEAFTTEHNRFFILEKSEFGYPFVKNSNQIISADLLTYVNFKFQFLESHLASSLYALHDSLIALSCKQDRQILEHEIMMAISNPEGFAFLRGGGAGYYSVTSGEVAYLIKCTPVPVLLRSTDHCYTEIPVFYNNVSMFLTPRTRILKQMGTIQDCSHQTPVKFQINGVWVAATPHFIETKEPSLLEATPFINWTYESPKNMFDAGIFTREDLETFQRRISFPLESQAATSSIIRQAMGLPQPHQIHYENFLTQASLDTIIQKTTRKIWGIFTDFGVVTSGFLGIFCVGKFIKALFDVFFVGKMLHEIFGYSWQMFACCCDSLSHYLVHDHHRKFKTRKNSTTISCPPYELQTQEPFNSITFDSPVHKQTENLISESPTLYSKFVCKPTNV
nr:PREDICTED: uncharacterized protein LOC109044507 [Bemisia tabaci]